MVGLHQCLDATADLKFFSTLLLEQVDLHSLLPPPSPLVPPFVCMYACSCVWVHVYMQAYMHVCAPVCGGHRIITLAIFPQVCSSPHFKQCFSLAWNHQTCYGGQLANPRDLTVFASPSWDCKLVPPCPVFIAMAKALSFLAHPGLSIYVCSSLDLSPTALGWCSRSMCMLL